MSKMVISYSSLDKFRNCRREYLLSKVMNLEHNGPKSDGIHMGKAFHEALEIFNNGEGSKAAVLHIDELHAQGRLGYSAEKNDLHWVYCRCMMLAYVERYGVFDGTEFQCNPAWEVLEVEMPFRQPITNPDTNHVSTRLMIEGRIDALVRMKDTGEVWILEAKTTAKKAEEFVRTLGWSDLQGPIYAWFAGQESGHDVKGVIYDVVTRSQNRFRKKQKEGPETVEQLEARIMEQYATSGDSMLRRHHEHLTPARQSELLTFLWTMKDQVLQAHRTIEPDAKLGDADIRSFFPNTAMCYRGMGRQWNCQFLDACTGRMHPAIMAANYTERIKTR